MNVAEFSKRVGLNPHTVRYYDKLGLLDKVQRLANGHRYFTPKDVAWVAFIQRLKATGMPLEDILTYATLRKAGAPTLAARHQLLCDHATQVERKLVEQQGHLHQLKEKIGLYQSALCGEVNLD
ncbi:MerR family transcriptional regulator [Salinimonas sediminis]|uniref:MerR family transcriptional regulator n=1 Tax=Salinimonas sediminis TaxID=2303538 RepID=A0A346NL34_9ALTE|nr:MerR family transcriptional regulator [Salinimonas sediminis]AXR06241.1 MerR family transcriptional regulator [Salinimonas sediminis]